MAYYYSDLKPEVLFPEQTGNIITFNDEYGNLPIKKCVVDFEDNTGISSLDFSVNGTIKTFNFGKTIQNGSLNVLTGELTNKDLITPEVINLGGTSLLTAKGENNFFSSVGQTTLQNISIRS